VARAELVRALESRNLALEMANTELDAFAHTVSHDLKAPLRHIIGFAEIASSQTLGTGEGERIETIGRITAAARKLEVLIDSFLAFSKTGRGSMRLVLVSLGALVRDVLRNLEPEIAGRTIAIEVGALPEVMADVELLRQVLVNLLSNAIKYTRGREAASIRVSSEASPAGFVTVSVADDGAGFDMRHVDRLFGVFQRLHRAEDFEGTGVGLATVRRIVARHGGKTGASGQLGAGATFWFSLPLVTEPGGVSCTVA
jgi:light-regulated signal transduction histidine kinase (bacteriophytochrome)